MTNNIIKFPIKKKPLYSLRERYILGEAYDMTRIKDVAGALDAAVKMILAKPPHMQALSDAADMCKLLEEEAEICGYNPSPETWEFMSSLAAEDTSDEAV